MKHSVVVVESLESLYNLQMHTYLRNTKWARKEKMKRIENSGRTNTRAAGTINVRFLFLFLFLFSACLASLELHGLESRPNTTMKADALYYSTCWRWTGGNGTLLNENTGPAD